MFLIANVLIANVKQSNVLNWSRWTNPREGQTQDIIFMSTDLRMQTGSVCPRSFREQQVSLPLSFESASQSCRGYVSHPGTRLGPVPLLSQQLILTLTDVPALSGGAA